MWDLRSVHFHNSSQTIYFERDLKLLLLSSPQAKPSYNTAASGHMVDDFTSAGNSKCPGQECASSANVAVRLPKYLTVWDLFVVLRLGSVSASGLVGWVGSFRQVCADCRPRCCEQIAGSMPSNHWRSLSEAGRL